MITLTNKGQKYQNSEVQFTNNCMTNYCKSEKPSAIIVLIIYIFKIFDKGMGWYLDKNTKLRGILLYILVNANRGNGRDVPDMSYFMLSTGTSYIWCCLIS